MKTRNMIVLIVAALFIFGSVTAYAQKGMGSGHGKGDHGQGGFGPGMQDELALTPDQTKQIQSMHVEMKKKLIPIEADLELAQLELHELIRSGANKTAIDTKIDALAAIKASIQRIKIGQMVQFRNMLTEEQKAKFDSRPMHRGGKGGMRDGRGSGREMGNGDCRFFGDDGRRSGNCIWLGDDDN
ncbi:MAG: Spy/CpxP family protein refolding chaperone [candidate division Zixibacteria bacterium]|nr:Spy/CpxP family protein refolding chaperone [candidate division Zixibacteria bacterium]MBU1472065.1 Spy/CpxP family protein refolding chaperone [candidate division Zixibacteria bacterium]MBU2623941.1 Spy/CpxP family protein refolding chaperone [candidate division Zixibacteria bacterium]